MSRRTSVKYTVYDVRAYFSKQPGDIRRCPACGGPLARSDIEPSKSVSDDLAEWSLIPVHEFSCLYECGACQWWAVRESWTLCEYYKEYDFLVVGEAGWKGKPSKNADPRVLPWKQVLENKQLYCGTSPLPAHLGELFVGGLRK